MEKLTKLQKNALQKWLEKAENIDKTADVINLDKELTLLLDNIEYEKRISYFPRIQ